MSQSPSDVSLHLASLSAEQQGEAIRAAVAGLPAGDKAVIARALTPVLPLPSDAARDRIWLIVVGTFAFALIVSVIVLGLGVFVKSEDPTKQITRSDTVLTIFTTVVGFLAGLLSPSPLAKKG